MGFPREYEFWLNFMGAECDARTAVHQIAADTGGMTDPYGVTGKGINLV